MVNQKEVLKSLGVTKTDSCIHYGRKRKLVRYSHGMTEEEAEKLTASRREERRASDSNQANQHRDDELVGDETESYEKVIFGQKRPDSLAIDWTSKMVYVLEFKCTSDQRRDYRERGESRALAQHDVLFRSLEKVAGETEREGGKTLFPNAELNLLSPGSGCQLQAGTGPAPALWRGAAVLRRCWVVFLSDVIGGVEIALWEGWYPA
jgi:hypothetical protein